MKRVAGAKPSRAKRSDKFYRCPNGHELPHDGDHGTCSPIYCGDVLAEGLRVRVDPKKVKRNGALPKDGNEAGTVVDLARVVGADGVGRAPVAPDEAAYQKELAALSLVRGRQRATETMLPSPPPMEGEVAEQYVTSKLISLSPVALRELELQLRFGDESERREAARQVLDRAGFAKSDQKVPSSGPVVVLVGAQVIQPPWQQPAAATTVDVKPEPK